MLWCNVSDIPRIAFKQLLGETFEKHSTWFSRKRPTKLPESSIGTFLGNERDLNGQSKWE